MAEEKPNLIIKYLSPVVFSAILSRDQTYIPKVNAGFWNSLKSGDIFTITDGERYCDVTVSGLFYFNNFGDAWFTLGDRMIPSHIQNIVTQGDAIKYYRRYYHDQDVAVCGVVCIHVTPKNQL